ncbi:MAG: MarR family transcriptional regulator [Armatimonadota bacterium]|nr:MarR family transcriptional regulator [Armatimonadota bacterium]
MKGLSPRQKLVLAILEEAALKGEHLTVREIGDRLGVSSTCTVHQHLKALERKGYLKPANHRHRALELTSPPKPFVSVPFAGHAVAGEAVEAAEEPALDGMPLPKELVGGEGGQLFRVAGNGLMPSGIRDGDMVLVVEATTCRAGDLVVSRANGRVLIGQLPQGAAPGTHSEAAPREGTLVGRVSLVIRRL